MGYLRRPGRAGESDPRSLAPGASVLIAMLAVGATLGGLILTGNRGLRQDMRRLDERISGLESQIGELRERMAHLEGLLEGLREAITGRARAS